MGKWRRHSLEFKKTTVARRKASENIRALARELGIEQKLLYTWKYQFEGRPEKNHASYAPKVSFFRHRKSIDPMSDSETGGGPV